MHQISDQWDGIGFFTILVSKTIMAKQDDYVRYTIRVPADLYSAIESAAADANRSINAEVVERLQIALSNDWVKGSDHDAAIEKFEDAIQVLRNAVKMHQSNFMAAANDAKLQVALLNSVCSHIISHGDAVPEHLRIFAKTVMDSNRETDWSPEQTESYIREWLDGDRK